MDPFEQQRRAPFRRRQPRSREVSGGISSHDTQHLDRFSSSSAHGQQRNESQQQGLPLRSSQEFVDDYLESVDLAHNALNQDFQRLDVVRNTAAARGGYLEPQNPVLPVPRNDLLLCFDKAALKQSVETPGVIIPYDGDDASEFPPLAKTLEIINWKVRNASTKKYGLKKAKVLTDAATVGKIRIFHTGRDQKGISPQDRNTFKKNYTCVDGQVYELIEKPKGAFDDEADAHLLEPENLAYMVVREHLHRVLVALHKQSNHGGRDKMRKILVQHKLAGVPKEILTEFKKHCPACPREAKPKSHTPRPKIARAKSPEAGKPPAKRARRNESSQGSPTEGQRATKGKKNKLLEASAAPTTSTQTAEQQAFDGILSHHSPPPFTMQPATFEEGPHVDDLNGTGPWELSLNPAQMVGHQGGPPYGGVPVAPQNHATFSFTFSGPLVYGQPNSSITRSTERESWQQQTDGPRGEPYHHHPPPPASTWDPILPPSVYEGIPSVDGFAPQWYHQTMMPLPNHGSPQEGFGGLSHAHPHTPAPFDDDFFSMDTAATADQDEEMASFTSQGEGRPYWSEGE